MKKAYSYIRFSSAEQAKGHSYQRQHDACVRWCEEHGYELAASEEYTFFDRGLSAFKGKHLGDSGQLKRFKDLVDKGAIAPGSTLIVESLDRLSRQEVDKALSQFLALLGDGIRIVTLQDHRIYDRQSASQATDLIVSIVMMSRAHEESVSKSQRVSAAWTGRKHLAARNELKPKGRSAPLWLALENDAYQQVEERVKVIEEIFRLAVSGHGRGVIAKRLNTAGVPSFKGVAWATSSIAKLLSNRAVLGEYQPMHMR